MSQQTGGEQPHRSELPDFSAQSTSAGLPAFAESAGPAVLGAPSERAVRRSRATMLAVIGGSAVVLLVLALILSQTVFRSVLEDPAPSAYETGQRTAEGQSEYVPDPEEPEIAPPPPIFTQRPTTDCTLPEYQEPAPATAEGAVRGGDLQFSSPEGWGAGWSVQSTPYLTEIGADARRVEGNWYSVVNLGRVSFTEEEGGYPGLENAAVAIFQCYATTSGVVSHFGEHPEVTDYRSEATTVDGEAAWIVQATYHFEDPEILETSSASVVTSIVVETPNGPSALASDVAADQPDHVEGLEEIIASLDVVE
ncbi:hypothetical protein [Brachybacterium saurashtrense]|uniref:Uncharacterized protein n=1 Tax=Brachybacterium saurashtrense TaxID=556288 RepID=A0A345YKE9_9MICO|nr:hypothetical protein [Brachybacterium saurashtrense]AXK44401.1 hypothetical protein DWV08_01370 [Brachybacterium saurashtrense]RRR23012.1 hypothetical protein DXU92_06500 [Brachybacterium saurashtrense]